MFPPWLKLKGGGIISGLGTFEHRKLIKRNGNEDEELLLLLVKVDSGLLGACKMSDSDIQRSFDSNVTSVSLEKLSVQAKRAQEAR